MKNYLWNMFASIKNGQMATILSVRPNTCPEIKKLCLFSSFWRWKAFWDIQGCKNAHGRAESKSKRGKTAIQKSLWRIRSSGNERQRKVGLLELFCPLLLSLGGKITSISIPGMIGGPSGQLPASLWSLPGSWLRLSCMTCSPLKVLKGAPTLCPFPWIKLYNRGL